MVKLTDNARPNEGFDPISKTKLGYMTNSSYNIILASLF